MAFLEAEPQIPDALKPLRASIVDEPPFVSGTLPLPPDLFTLYYHDDATDTTRRINLARASPDELTALAHACQPATFGLGQKDVLDETYRKATKMDADAFSTPLVPERTALLDIVRGHLLEGVESTRPIKVELYKLNVYGEGAFFKAHVDTPRSKSMFGSLVVVFPTDHEGGTLTFRHGRETWDFDSSRALSDDQAQTPSTPSVAFASFFSDVQHEVSLVTRGHRVTLTYNLYFGDMEKGGGDAGDATNTRMDILSANEAQIRGCLETSLTDPTFLTDGGTLGFGLRHVYQFSDSISHVPRLLKGRDAMIYRVFSTLGFVPTVYLVYNDEEMDFLLDAPFEMRRRCIDGHYSYLKAVRDNGGIVLEHVNDDAEVDEDVAWVTAVDEGLNTHSRGYAATYGNAPSCEYSYGDMCLVVRVGKPEDRTTPPEPKALKAAARKRRRRESRRELRRTWYKERLRVGGTSYTEPPLMSDDEPLTDSEGTSYDEPEMPEESIDLPPSPSPVYALPPELLCRIFAELCREEPLGGCDNDKDIIVGELSWYISEDEDCENDDDDETSDTSDHSSSSSLCEQRGTLGWAKVTHVCRRWRYAALIDATLWRAFIPGVNAQWTAEILRRSQAAALDLRVPSTERLVCISGDVMARVRSLAIKYTGPSKDEAYNFLAHPAPLLEQFEIAIPGRRFADALPLRFPLFDGHAPKLVRFSATEAFGIPWASSLFDSLTNLAIEYNPSLWRYRQHPTLSNILALLHRARAITMLTLVGCFPTKVREDEAWSERVALPELKYIRLGGVSVGVVTSFLSFVNVPSTATVHVKMFQDAANSGDEWNQEVVSLFNLVSCDHSASVGTMFMSFNLHWLCISSSYDAVPPESLAHPLSHSFDRSLVIEGKTWKVERSLAEHLLAAAPPTAVRALSFATSDNDSDSDALFPLSTPQAFVHAASVEHLRLAGKCGADKLASFIRALEPDTGGAVYFPSLSSLALPNIGLRSAPSEGESDPSVEGALRSMLALRGAAGHRIGTLYVDKGTFKRQRTSREPWMDDLDVKVVPRGYASGEHRLWR